MPNLMDPKSLDIVLDVKVKVTVQLGSVLLPMREVLELAPGSVVQFTQHASDPVGLFVNDKLVAYGESSWWKIMSASSSRSSSAARSNERHVRQFPFRCA